MYARKQGSCDIKTACHPFQIDVMAEYKKRQQMEKSQINLVVIGECLDCKHSKGRNGFTLCTPSGSCCQHDYIEISTTIVSAKNIFVDLRV